MKKKLFPTQAVQKECSKNLNEIRIIKISKFGNDCHIRKKSLNRMNLKIF